MTECTVSRYEPFETSPETIEQELRHAVCQHRQTDRLKENYGIYSARKGYESYAVKIKCSFENMISIYGCMLKVKLDNQRAILYYVENVDVDDTGALSVRVE